MTFDNLDEQEKRSYAWYILPFFTLQVRGGYVLCTLPLEHNYNKFGHDKYPMIIHWKRNIYNNITIEEM